MFVCFVLLLGQYHCEEGLGEWVVIKDFFNPPSLVLKASAPIMPKAMLAGPSNAAAALQYSIYIHIIVHVHTHSHHTLSMLYMWFSNPSTTSVFMLMFTLY